MSMSGRRVTDVLRGARARIADVDHWTTKVQARAADGQACPPWHPAAVRWCAWGALHASVCRVVVREAGSLHVAFDRALVEAVDARVLRVVGDRPLEEVNDIDGHAAVLAVLDPAIGGT